MLRGTIVENSLKDTSILSTVTIERTWNSGDWILHDVLLSKDQALSIGQFLAEGPWYVHFWEPGKDDVLVVYRDKSFWITHSDRSTWADAVAHGKSLGIPDQQLDFVIT